MLRFVQLAAPLLCLAAATAADANTYHSFTTSSGSGEWSDPTTWKLDAAPVQDPGGQVIVSPGTTLAIDKNVTVASITVAAGGVLSCGQRGSNPVTLTTGRIVVERGGCFVCTGSASPASDCGAAFAAAAAAPAAGASSGSNFAPYDGPTFTVRLASTQAPATAEDDVRTVLVKDGGALVFAGKVRGTSSVARLAEHAMAGTTELVVQVDGSATVLPPSWAVVGDIIAIAPTDYHPDQTEYARVVAVRMPETSDTGSNKGPPAALLQIDAPLKYAHAGRAYGLIHPTSINPPNQTFVLDTRAELALLSRNIVIQGTADDPDGLKGDVKIMGGDARAYISWAAFKDLGRRGHLGRYPLHFHGVGGRSGGANVDVRHVAVHRSSQRGIVVHCTSGANLDGNVVADVEGFAYMLEDGAEENNVFTNNLALDVRAPNLAPSRNTNDSNNSINNAALLTELENPAGFWFLNAANTFVGNVAAGVRGSGFSLDLDPRMILRPSTYTVCPEQVPGFDVRLLASTGSAKSPSLLGMGVYRALASKTFTRFENNAVHAAHTGLWMTSLPQMGATLTIESFTAWKIAPRSGPGSSRVAFDACIRASGVLDMRVNRLVCANSALSYWSTEPGLVTNTLLAWLTDGPSVDGQGPQIIPSGAKWQAPWLRQAGLVSYLSSQTFAGTYAYGLFPGASQSSDFSVGASGSLTGAHNLIYAFRRDTAAASSSYPVLALDSRMQHVYTDLTGDLFGQGAGARALCSCPGCGDQVDPLVAAYASGQCGAVAVAPQDAPEGSIPSAGTTPAIACKGGAAPLLCRPRGPDSPAPSFVSVELRGVSRPGRVATDQALQAQAPFAAGASTAAAAAVRLLVPNDNVVGTSAWRFLAPMTQAAADGFGGGYRVISSVGWAGLTSMAVVVGPTAEPQGAITIVISRAPASADLYADVYPWRDLPRSSVRGVIASRVDVIEGTANPSSCPALLQTCRPPGACVCQSTVDEGVRDIYIRFQTWGEMDASIRDPQGQPFLYKLSKYQLRVQLDPQSAAVAPPDDLFATLNTALQNPPV